MLQQHLVIVSTSTRATPQTVRFVRPLHTDGRGTTSAASDGEPHAQPDWPVSTDCLCWHCCHPFCTPPIPLASQHDQRTDSFTLCPAYFCTWSCAKAYSRTMPNFARIACTQTLLRKRMTGTASPVVSAPPRCMLRAFGGVMDIEEFRAASDDGVYYSTMPDRYVLQTTCVEKMELRPAKRKGPEVPLTAQQGAAALPQLKLKRTKPLQNSKQQLVPFFESLLKQP